MKMKKFLLTALVCLSTGLCSWSVVACGDTSSSSESSSQTQSPINSSDNSESSSTEHTHDYQASVTDPTCLADGYTTYSCSCGDSYVGDETSASGHSVTDWTVTIPVTCEADGERKGECGRCRTEITETLEKLEHVYEWEHTLTEHWQRCVSGCNDTTEKQEHNWNVDNQCTVCGYDLEYSKNLAYTAIKDGETTVAYAVGAGTNTDEIVVLPAYHNQLPVSEIVEKGFQNIKTVSKVVTTCNLKAINESGLRKSSVKEILFFEGLEKIGVNVFYELDNLECIRFPDSLHTLEKLSYVFYNCPSLVEVVFGTGLTELPSSCFSNCPALEKVEIPDSITVIGGGAFSNCTALTEIELPNQITEIARHTFSGCTSLTSVTVPNKVEKIGEYAFKDCSVLGEIVLPEGLSTIERYAFQNCYSLLEITVPSTVTTAGAYIFDHCYRLNTVYNLSSALNRFTFEIESVSATGIYPLEYFTTKTAESDRIVTDDGFVFIKPTSVQGALNYTGYCLAYVTGEYEEDLVLPEMSFNYAIHSGALYGNEKVKNLYVPKCADAFLEYSFVIGSLPAVENLYYKGTVAEWMNIKMAAVNANGWSCPPKQSLYFHDGARYTLLTDLVIPNTVSYIGYGRFNGVLSIKSVTIPKNVKKIYAYAFEGCSNLASASFGNTSGWFIYNLYGGIRIPSLSNKATAAGYLLTGDYAGKMWEHV